MKDSTSLCPPSSPEETLRLFVSPLSARVAGSRGTAGTLGKCVFFRLLTSFVFFPGPVFFSSPTRFTTRFPLPGRERVHLHEYNSKTVFTRKSSCSQRTESSAPQRQSSCDLVCQLKAICQKSNLRSSSQLSHDNNQRFQVSPSVPAGCGFGLGKFCFLFFFAIVFVL